jgi:hypothetical protein
MRQSCESETRAHEANGTVLACILRHLLKREHGYDRGDL